MIASSSTLLLACFASCTSAFTIASDVYSFSSCMQSEDVMGINSIMLHTARQQQHPAVNSASNRISPLSAYTKEEATTLPTITDEDETTAVDNPLKSAGLSFVSASSKSLGMLFYNIGGMDHKEIQALLLEAGTHLVAAGEAWSSDWDAVRECMSSASHAFYDISNVFGSANIDESMPLGTLFEKIGRELEDISEISGCCAVGPPCSSPNLLAVEEQLIEISKILKKNSVAATDEHMMCTPGGGYDIAGDS